MRPVVLLLFCSVALAANDSLLQGLLSPDEPKRETAAASVRTLEPGERVAIAKQLAALLKDDSAAKQRAAARGLEELGPEARIAVPALLAALRSRDPELQYRVLEALSEIEDGSAATVEAVLGAAADLDDDIRGAAISVLWDVGGSSDKVMDVLIDALGDASESVRWRAAIALRRRGKDASRAATALGEALRDEDADVREASIEALQALGVLAQPAWRDLIGQLNAKDIEFALDVAGVLGAIESSPDIVVPRIKGHLAAKDWKIRSKAGWALAQFGTGARLAIEELEVASRDKHPAVRRTALQAIYAAYPKRPGAYEAYDKAYDDEQRWRILDHYKHDLNAALAALTQGLKVGREINRVVAANALGNLGEAARPALPALLEATKDPAVAVRAASLLALAEVRMLDPTPILPLLKAKEPSIRDAAVEAVGRARKLTDVALDGMVALLADDVEGVCDQASWTLEEIGEAAVDALLRGIARDKKLRVAALETLGAIGPAAAGAIGSITTLCADTDEDVREAARAALEAIRE